MKVDDIHQEIKSFIKDLSTDNLKIMEIGSIQAFFFKIPKIIIFFKKDGTIIRNMSNCVVKYENKLYSELEFVKLLELRVFW